MRQYIPENFGLNPTFWIGKVEDRSDPLQMGRVRVRIYGHHSPDTNLIPTELLPWAIPLMPAFNASLSGVGQSPTGIMIGTICFGIWLDGSDMQTPMVMGTLNAQEGEGSPGTPGVSTTQNTITDNNYGAPGDFSPTGDGPRWLQVARGELGQKDIKGGQHNPRVLEYLRTVGLGGGDETAWCAAFVAWSLKNSGQSYAGMTGAARSGLRASAFKPIDKLAYGCICVLNRGSNPAHGHIGFYVGSKGGRIILLGGNQNSSVMYKGYSTDRILGLRWPAGAPMGETAEQGEVKGEVVTTDENGGDA